MSKVIKKNSRETSYKLLEQIELSEFTYASKSVTFPYSSNSQWGSLIFNIPFKIIVLNFEYPGVNLMNDI